VNLRRWAARIFGFTLIPALAMLSPFVALPFITRAAGAEGWAAIATGQALGAIASLVIQFGWGTTGPPLVAALGETSGRSLYFTSVLMRIGLLIVAAPVAMLVTSAIVPNEWMVIAILLCASSSVSGLSPGWYFVGLGRPRPLLWFETLPRLFGVFLSTALIAITGNLLLYGVVMIVVESAMVIVSAAAVSSRSMPWRWHVGEIRLHARAQWSLAVSALVSSGYTRLAVPIVAVVAFSQAPVFASVDRVQTLSRSTIKPFIQSLQGWVAEARDDNALFRRRFWTASLVVGSITSALAIAIVALVPLVDNLLFGPQIEISYLAAGLLATALLAIGLSNCTATFFLAPTLRVTTISMSTIAGSVIGVPVLWAATSAFGAIGALGAIAGVELFVLTWQSVVVVRALRDHSEYGH